MASTVSFRSTHPIAWMHGLPAGESPGWNSKKWLILETQLGNFWNAEMDLRDVRTGDLYTYAIDFEQLMTQVEGGFEVSDDLAVSFALPFVSRFGGILDQPLDDWHIFVGADRFRRNQFPKGKNRFSVQRNGEEILASDSASGLGMALAKLKWWFYRGKSSPRPEFDGLSLSLQTRLPIRSSRSTLSTGNAEASVLLHGGANISETVYLWISTGFTKFSPNPIFEDWPQRQWAQLYELWAEIPLTERWDLIFQLRYESPLLDKQHLEFQYISTSSKTQSAERAASGWNGLTAWRGTESFGFRYHLKEKRTLLFVFQEDWALGDNDGRNNFLYVHGAPDVALIGQLQIAF